jgi:F0F1-type ATP synthase membrane subunit b/b'
MLALANAALSQTFALVVTFVGIGVVVNVLVIYAIGQVLAERRENLERRERGF